MVELLVVEERVAVVANMVGSLLPAPKVVVKAALLVVGEEEEERLVVPESPWGMGTGVTSDGNSKPKKAIFSCLIHKI